MMHRIEKTNVKELKVGDVFMIDVIATDNEHVSIPDNDESNYMPFIVSEEYEDGEIIVHGGATLYVEEELDVLVVAKMEDIKEAIEENNITDVEI